MINLLPPDAKAEIRAGRANRLLIRYLVLFTGLMLLLFVAIGIVLYTMSRTEVTSKAAITATLNKSSKIKAEQKQVEQYIANLKIAKQILDSQTNYSTIILRIASVIPQGVVIDSLSLDSSSFTKPTTLTARAKSDRAALAFKQALTSSPYFKDPHFSSITSGGSGSYPITISLDVTFTKELFR